MGSKNCGVVISIDRGTVTTVTNGDLSYSWFTSFYPFEEMTCGHDLLGHANPCGDPSHHMILESIANLEMEFQQAALIDRELRNAKLLMDDPESARRFTSLDSWLTKHYDELIILRERFAGFYGNKSYKP